MKPLLLPENCFGSALSFLSFLVPNLEGDPGDPLVFFMSPLWHLCASTGAGRGGWALLIAQAAVRLMAQHGSFRRSAAKGHER